MAFLVYFFVLLVAVGSVIFGLDWTQAPLNAPPYAAPPAQMTTAAPAANPAVQPTPVKPATASVSVAKTTPAPTAPAHVAPVLAQAAQAQASATAADTTASTAAPAASCNVDACSAAYRSFRASDCTYQPNSGERRLCTKSAGKIAAATHPRSSARRDEYRYSDRRINDRRDYYDRRDAYQDDRPGGWSLGGLFGGSDDY